MAILGAFPAFADDKLRATLEGTAEVSGIDESGTFVVPSVPSHALRKVHGKVEVLAKYGDVRRVETYTEWAAPNEVRLKVWEKIFVSGGVFVGWIESNIETPGDRRSSRTVIEGDIVHEIGPSGHGFIEWTVAGERNRLETGKGEPDEDVDLPTIDILEEGRFDAVFKRRIEIKSRKRVKLLSSGYERVLIQDANGVYRTEVYLDQDFELSGRSSGSLDYDPDDVPGDPTPTPSPTPGPSPTATPLPTPRPLF